METTLKKRGRPCKRKKEPVSNIGDDIISQMIREVRAEEAKRTKDQEKNSKAIEESEPEEICVKHISLYNDYYLIDQENRIYDVCSHECIGEIKIIFK